MWCPNCGQDVPPIPAADDMDLVVCRSCHARWVPRLGSESHERIDQPHASSQANSPPKTSTSREPGTAARRPWESASVASTSASPGAPPRVVEFEDAHEYSTTCGGCTSNCDQESARPSRRLSMHTAEPAPAPHFRSARRHDGRSTTFCWCMLGLGVALFACGASLVAWSLLGERSELWNVGAPCALAGQVCFLIGLVLQLDVIWQHSKETSRTLDVLDRRLSRWQERSKSLEGKRLTESQRQDEGHRSPATNPQIMLTELRSQLDRLATRISSHDRLD